MTDKFIIFIPTTPVAKARARFTSKGFSYTPKKTKDAENIIRSTLGLQTHPKFTGPVALSLVFHLKKPKSSKNKHPMVRPDVDNYVKTVMDALNGVLFDDDSQVVSLSAKKKYSDEEGITIVIGDVI